MATKTFTDKNGNEWSWEETPELIEALKELQEINNDTQSKPVV